MSIVLSDPITISSIPENHMVDSKNDKSASMLLKMTLIHCLTLYKWQQSLILAHSAMPKVFFDRTTMSGMPENPIVDTKITNLLLF